MSNPIGLLTVITQYPLLVIKGCLFLLVCFLSLKEISCETGRNIFVSFKKLFMFSRKSNFGILDIQVSYCHQTLNHKTRNTFY